ncbi:MAG: 5'-nucleotidase [Gammaproteobacteria bacterium]|nr:5'-nucleotidase [Gammaproteobacteria bacterium]
MPDAETYLTVAVSSRALFDLDASDAVYRQQGLEAYRRYQIVHEDETLAPGEGFTFVTKLLGLNEELGRRRVDVILLSRNSADTGLRVFNSIHAHELDIVRAAFSSGASPYRYARAFGCDLFLSTEAGDVQHALDSGMAAATLLARGRANETRPDVRRSTLKIAFDGDAVLFSDAADRIFRDEGLEAFASAEAAAADEPLGGGPFKPFLEGLHRLQQEFDGRDCPIRTALVTARGAPAHKRVIKTLRAWDIRLDESLFLGGLDKGEFLRAYEADVFFDDQAGNCHAAGEHVATGHVPHGVRNEAD